MHSCLYRGHVRHRREDPEHQFQYSSSWAYFDLSELDQVLSKCRLLSGGRFAPISFRREDHFGDLKTGLDASVREKLQQETALELSGPMLLTQFRHFGLFFSPLNIFYCFEKMKDFEHDCKSRILPGIKHTYVLWDGNRGWQQQSLRIPDFHVPPSWEWTLSITGKSDTLRGVELLSAPSGGKRIFPRI